MKKLLTGILIGLALLPEFPAKSAEPDQRFALVVKKDQVELINGAMRVKTTPNELTTSFSGPFGNFPSYGFNYPLAEIKVESDTDEEKSVALIFPGPT